MEEATRASQEKARGDISGGWGRRCSVDLERDIGYGRSWSCHDFCVTC
jgi:hypothetical protein